MDTKWDAPTRWTATIVLGILFVYGIYLSRAVLPLLIIAALIAFLLAPVVSFLRRRAHLPRGLAVMLAYLLALLFVLLVPLILIPALFDAFGDINIDLIALTRRALAWLNATLESYRTIRVVDITYDLSPVVDPTLETLANISPTQFLPSLETVIASIPSTIQFTWGVASNVVGTLAASLLAFILTLLYSIYLTADGGAFIRAFIRLVPGPYQAEFTELYRRTRAIWSAYFRGQFILGLIIGLLTWLIGLAIGLPGALALGVIAGVLEILPNLGPILAAIPALLIALVQGSTALPVSNGYFMLIVLGAYVVIQQLENNIIVPKILGDAVELHPLVVMVGVVVGATTAGILGALIAAPTIATVRLLAAYTYAKILQSDTPFPPTKKAAAGSFPFAERFRDLRQKLQTMWPPTAKKPASPGEEN
ncbi:MAG: AI-2E family transporter [Anaerolineae bacterium]